MLQIVVGMELHRVEFGCRKWITAISVKCHREFTGAGIDAIRDEWL